MRLFLWMQTTALLAECTSTHTELAQLQTAMDEYESRSLYADSCWPINPLEKGIPSGMKWVADDPEFERGSALEALLCCCLEGSIFQRENLSSDLLTALAALSCEKISDCFMLRATEPLPSCWASWSSSPRIDGGNVERNAATGETGGYCRTFAGYL